MFQNEQVPKRKFCKFNTLLTNERPGKRKKTMSASTSCSEPSVVGTEPSVRPLENKLSAPVLPVQPAELYAKLVRLGLPKIFGKFNLFEMDNPRYCNIYKSKLTGTSTFHPETLLAAIYEYQAISKIASINFPQQYASADNTKPTASFKTTLLCNDDGPLDILVSNFVSLPWVNMDNEQGGLPPHTWFGPSAKADLTLKRGHRGVKKFSGSIKMRPVWKDNSLNKDGGKELFEGSLSFTMEYEDYLRARGYMSVSQPGFGFWAVRAEQTS